MEENYKLSHLRELEAENGIYLGNLFFLLISFGCMDRALQT